jgi:hypothetical protein
VATQVSVAVTKREAPARAVRTSSRLRDTLTVRPAHAVPCPSSPVLLEFISRLPRLPGTRVSRLRGGGLAGRQNIHMRRRTVCRALIALGIGASAIISSVSAASPLLPHSYGPLGGRFVVSFGAPTKNLDSSYTLVTEGDWKFRMKPHASGYEAALGGNAYEEVDIAIYPRTPSARDVTRYLEWNVKPGGELRRWHGLPSAYENHECREGDSPILCPGRVADLWIVNGRVVYELSATQVSQAEVARFFGSFRPAE